MDVLPQKIIRNACRMLVIKDVGMDVDERKPVRDVDSNNREPFKGVAQDTPAQPTPLMDAQANEMIDEVMKVTLQSPPDLPISLYLNGNHKVYVAIVKDEQPLITTVSIVDIGAGANRLKYDALHEYWKAEIQKGDRPRLRCANGQNLDWQGTVERQVTLGELTVPVTFGVVRGLAVNCLIGRAFTEKHVKKMHAMDRYFRPSQSREYRCCQTK